MNRLFLSMMAICLTACFGTLDLDGNPAITPDGCCETVCDPVERVVELPSTIEEFDVGANRGYFAIAWQEDASDQTRGWVMAIDATEPEMTPMAHELESGSDHDIGVHHPQVVWFDHDPRVVYSLFDGTVGGIVMKTFSTDTGYLTSSQSMIATGHAVASRAVYHPSGELALSWTGWSSPGADPRAWFSRFSEAGELIDSYSIAPDEYAYGPRIKPVSSGYSIAYTSNDDPYRRRVLSTNWNFATGLERAIQINPDLGKFTALDLAVTSGLNAVLWQITPNPSYPHLNVAFISWIGADGVSDSVALDDVVMGLDVLDLDGESLVSWCSMDTETMEFSLNVTHVSAGSLAVVLQQNLGEDACNLTQLTAFGNDSAVFWTQSGSQLLHYRMICE